MFVLNKGSTLCITNSIPQQCLKIELLFSTISKHNICKEVRSFANGIIVKQMSGGGYGRKTFDCN